ncbi:MAG: hypothetical protein HZC24_11635 [Rhodocyclales bacterium]|nr:hypothetical protein [Rhodocyclales bacterium]
MKRICSGIGPASLSGRRVLGGRTALRRALSMLALALLPGLAVPDEALAKNGRAARVPVKKPAAKTPKPVKKLKKARKPADVQKRAETPPAAATAANERWQDLQRKTSPKALLRSCEEFAKDFPASEHGPALKDLLTGAQLALAAQRAAQLSSDAVAEAEGDEAYRGELAKAARGDKDAAARIALMYAEGGNGLPHSARRHEQWLRVAAELGNATASWQLAELLNRAGLWGEAAKYETRSVELGLQLPPRLPTKSRDI